MTPQQALSILDGLVSKMNLTREQHDMAKAAVITLHNAITPKPEKPSEPTGSPELVK